VLSLQSCIISAAKKCGRTKKSSEHPRKAGEEGREAGVQVEEDLKKPEESPHFTGNLVGA
jgi:hypothetical protein